MADVSSAGEIIAEKDERSSFKTLVGIGCLFFNSMLNVRCSKFDVHLKKNSVILSGNFL
ncbi:MAG: hypothetical protein QG578_360 [Thermodesulfobacteriota bacterium]|nr:hypothetical protein [Thermodesulfobacteriota bacterium]